MVNFENNVTSKENVMAFVNEKISKEDWEKYNIDQINMRWNGLKTAGYQWAIDREREIWLRKFYESRDRDNNGAWDGKTVWDFYWKGILMSIKTQRSNFTFLENGGISMRYKLLELYIPPEGRDQDREEILADIAEAFATYGSAGIYDETAIKTVTFDASNYKLVDTNRFTC